MARVLVVDNTLTIRNSLKRSLGQNGHVVFESEDVARTRLILKQNQVDVILLNIDSREGPAGEFIQYIKQQHEPPIVLVLTSDKEQKRFAPLQKGVFDVLTLPVSKEKLEQSLAYALRFRFLTEENRRFRQQFEEMVKERTAELQANYYQLQSAQKALLESEERYRLLFNEPDSANLYCDTRGNICLANQMAARLYKKFKSIRNAISSVWVEDEFRSWPKSEESKFQQRVDLVLEHKQSYEYVDCLDNNQEVMWFVSRFHPVTDYRGELLGIQCSTRDITKQKKSEQELTLRHDELVSKTKELELAYRYKSEFLANMSHELRTPLNSILLLSGLLVESPINLSKKQLKYCQVINDSGSILLDLINDVLELSRIESGKISLLVEEFLLEPSLDELIRSFRIQAEQKGLRFKFRLDSLTQIETDPQRLGQILRNLLSNALKFTRKGHIGLEVVHKVTNPACVDIVISDTGDGIPKIKQTVIFDAFEQADSSISRQYGGTGLGLAICKKLTTLLGGTILLESKEGQGSRFTLRLPIRFPQEVEGADISKYPSFWKPRPPESKELSNINDYPLTVHSELFPQGKILIVDNDARSVFAIINLLEHTELNFLTARNGKEGLNILAEEPHIDLILMDLATPVMDGYEFIRQGHTIIKNRKIPIIITTSKADNSDSDFCKTFGIAGYLTKPFEYNHLISTVISVMEDSLSTTGTEIK